MPEILKSARADRGVVQLSGALLGVSDELGERLDRQ